MRALAVGRLARLTPRTILVDHAGLKGLGDVVVETGYYAALKARYPDARLVSRRSRRVAWGHPLIDAFDETTPESAFDAVYRRLPPLDTPSRSEALRQGLSIFDRFHLQIGLDRPTERPRLYVLERELAELGLEDDGGGGWIIAYSADSRELDRRWGEERFLELAHHLETAHGASLIELGAGLTSGHMGVGIDLVGKTSHREAMAVLHVADLFIGNHGGLTHVAGALGTPILSPWGASHPADRFAYDDWSVAIEPDLPCRHCRWTGQIPGACWVDSIDARTPCTQVISVEQMKAAADALLERLRPERSRLRAGKKARLSLARDPQTLDRYDLGAEVSADTHAFVPFGGGWAAEHRPTGYQRLSWVTVFPDWLALYPLWHDLLATYARGFTCQDRTLLVLPTYPLNAVEAANLLVSEAQRLGLDDETLPPIVLVLGHLSTAEREALVASSAAFVPLGTELDVPSDRSLTPTELAAWRSLRERA